MRSFETRRGVACSRALFAALLLPGPAVAAPGDHLEAALQLLPKRPEVVVVHSFDARSIAAAAAWGVKADEVRAFVLASDARTVYVLLAALIWHEASHLEGADEEAAQQREEELVRQFVTEHRMDFTAGHQVLRTMAARRERRR